MKLRHTLAVLSGIAISIAQTHAQDYPTNRAQALELVQSLKFQHGDIQLDDGLAKLSIPAEFKFLGREDAAKVLVNLWQNPPSDDTLGLLMPANKTPLDDDCWVVTISFSDDGYVKDDDAAKIDYNDLLKDMKKDAKEASKERVKQGYPSVELVGWAAQPHYDAQAHKLYWAKELKFGGESGSTLNYNIRILGRRGVLVLNAIASMEQLAEIEKNTPQILAMVNFNEGHRYADFNPKGDKVAAYGLAALVAGGVASKLGFFKLIWVAILAGKKFIIIGIVALAAIGRRLLARKRSTP